MSSTGEVTVVQDLYVTSVTTNQSPSVSDVSTIKRKISVQKMSKKFENLTDLSSVLKHKMRLSHSHESFFLNMSLLFVWQWGNKASYFRTFPLFSYCIFVVLEASQGKLVGSATRLGKSCSMSYIFSFTWIFIAACRTFS